MVVYVIENSFNQKRYVGQTSFELQSRLQTHKYEALQRNSPYYFHKAIRKYGWDNFNLRAVINLNSKAEMDELEMFLIEEMHTYNPCGYNMTMGGEGSLGWNPSAETRNKMRLKKIGSKKNIKNLEAYSKLRSGTNNPMYGRRGENNPNYGRKFPERGNKTRESLLGVKHPTAQCPYCNKVGGARGMKRYHFTNCRYAILATQGA